MQLSYCKNLHTLYIFFQFVMAESISEIIEGMTDLDIQVSDDVETEKNVKCIVEIDVDEMSKVKGTEGSNDEDTARKETETTAVIIESKVEDSETVDEKAIVTTELKNVAAAVRPNVKSVKVSVIKKVKDVKTDNNSDLDVKISEAVAEKLDTKFKLPGVGDKDLKSKIVKEDVTTENKASKTNVISELKTARISVIKKVKDVSSSKEGITSESYYRGQKDGKAAYYANLQGAEASDYGGLRGAEAADYGDLRGAEAEFYGDLREAEAEFYVDLREAEAEFYGDLRSAETEFYGDLRGADVAGYERLRDAEAYGYKEVPKFRNVDSIENIRNLTEEEKGANLLSGAKVNSDGLWGMDSPFHAMLFAEELMEYVLSNLNYEWPLSGARKLNFDEAVARKKFSPVIGDTVLEIISRSIDHIVYCYRGMLEKGIHDVDTYRRELCITAVMVFKEGYNHREFLMYAAMVCGVSAFYFEAGNMKFADASCQVLAYLLNYFIYMVKFLPEGDYFYMCIEAQILRRAFREGVKIGRMGS